MVPRRHEESLSGSSTGGGSGGGSTNTNHDNNNDDDAHISTNIDDDTNPTTTTTATDIWATAEGYTPLADLMTMNNSGFVNDDDDDQQEQVQVMVSMGPMSYNDVDDDDNNSNNNDNGGGNTWHRGGGAFFVNPAAFSSGADNDNNEDDDNNDSHDDGDGKEEKDEHEPPPSSAMMGYDTVSTSDFEDVAARALRALDDEYNLAARSISDTNNNSGSARITGTTNDRERLSETTTTTITSIATESPIVDPQDRIDNQIIAAAFDKRKEELQRIQQLDDGFLVDWGDDDDHSSTSNTNKNQIDPTSTSSTSSKTTNDQQQQQDVSSSSSSSSSSSNKVSSVDTDAIRRAVTALSTNDRNTPFQLKFAAWQAKQQQSKKKKKDNTMNELPQHALISPTQCNAFYRNTPKAKEATSQLTRSATIAEAMVRLKLMQGGGEQIGSDAVAGQKKQPSSLLLIDVVGVDHVECKSPQTIVRTFQPIVRWLMMSSSSSSSPSSSSTTNHHHQYENIHFRLIGRDLMMTTKQTTTKIDLLENIDSHDSTIKAATATCHSGVYHEMLSDGTLQQQTSMEDGDINTLLLPQMIIAFNAGIWGYSEWETTIDYLHHHHHSTNNSSCSNMIITAYTLSECQEDYDVIDRIVNQTKPKKDSSSSSSTDLSTSLLSSSSSSILWKPEMNPFGSQIVRDTKSSTSEYRENAAWQAWRLGGTPSVEHNHPNHHHAHDSTINSDSSNKAATAAVSTSPPPVPAAAAAAPIAATKNFVVETTRAADTHLLDDIQDLKWKLYGKNVYFGIVFEAVIKIQAFVRGSLCRAKTADRIDELIGHILQRREEAAQDELQLEKYRQQDLLDQQRYREMHGEDDDKRTCRTEMVYKPWKPTSDPFEKLLAKRAKRDTDRKKSSTIAVINAHSPTVCTQNSTVEIIDVGTSLNDRLRTWNSKTGSNAENQLMKDKGGNGEGKAEEGPGEDVPTAEGVVETRIKDVSSETDSASHGNKNGYESDGNGSQQTRGSSSVASGTYHSLAGSSVDTKPHDNTIHSFNQKQHQQKQHNQQITRSRPWMDIDDSTRKDNSGHNNEDDIQSVEPMAMLPTFLEEEATGIAAAAEPSGKGYSRYRSGMQGRNKKHPWRDDTDVFDAY